MAKTITKSLAEEYAAATAQRVAAEAALATAEQGRQAAAEARQALTERLARGDVAGLEPFADVQADGVLTLAEAAIRGAEVALEAAQAAEAPLAARYAAESFDSGPLSLAATRAAVSAAAEVIAEALGQVAAAADAQDAAFVEAIDRLDTAGTWRYRDTLDTWGELDRASGVGWAMHNGQGADRVDRNGALCAALAVALDGLGLTLAVGADPDGQPRPIVTATVVDHESRLNRLSRITRY